MTPVPSPASPAPLTFSIILCTYERTADLLATLGSFHHTALPEGTTGELIVVDSSRTEATRRALADDFAPIPGLPLRVLHEPRRGKAHAMNTGTAAARGKVLLFTDDDIRVPVVWIEAMIEPILSGAADAVVGGIHLAPGLHRSWMKDQHRAWMADTSVLNQQQPEVLIGANMALGRHVFDQVPGFDPELGAGTQLGGCDESLFGMQLFAAGYRVTGAFHASVEHHFHPDRLHRRSFLDRAGIEGRSAAYIAYHWRHETIANPYREMLSPAFKLLVNRWVRRAPWKFAEVAPKWELVCLIRLHFLRQYLRERRRPRKYAKLGLVKQGS